MNEFRHEEDFIAVIKQIIKIKEDFLSLQAWAQAQAMLFAFPDPISGLPWATPRTGNNLL